MPRLEIFLLGMPQIRVDGAAFAGLASHKARALLLYLALTKQQHARQTLAGLFWGEMSESNARRNLRVTLTKLKAELGEFLLVRRRTLSINPDADIWLDVTEFEKCLAPAEPTLDQLQRAASLYGGHFLDGFVLREAPLFEDWTRPLQERYRQMAMETLYRLAVYHTQKKQYGTGIDYAGRLLTLEPWMEEAHRQMMLLQALSGQRSAALAQYETCRAMLDNELGVEPTEATTNLYKQILNEEIGEDLTKSDLHFPEPAIAPPFQPPAQSPHFVGRLTLLGNLSTALTSAKSQQIHALVGMGGIGKSTVAVQLAHIVRSSFADGVLWAQAATAEPMAILESWAQAYGYDFTRIGDVESMAAAFRGVLADKSVLIVLDDVRSMARIRPLLPNGKQNQVLITTRNQDLARSLNAQVWPLQELSPENGRLLLTGILGESRTGDEPDAAAEICELLENHPLAVEITAQRLKSRPRRRLSDMAQRLRDEKQRLTLLAISDREVRASFAVSWQALDAAHRRVFALLGLFNGRSFTAEAIAHIVDLDQYTIEDQLFALAALSLIREDEPTRYRQHPLLADFAREQLGEDVGKENGRFADYYLHFAQQHQQDYDTLRPEWDNMMSALEQAYNNHFWQLVIDMANALHSPWFMRGRYSQARQGYQWAYEAANKLEEVPTKADILLQWGRAAIEQRDHEIASEYLEKGLEFYISINNQAGASDCYCDLARIALEQSRYQDALNLINEGRKIRLLLDDTNGIAETYYLESRVTYFSGNYRKAQSLSLKALEIQETLSDINGMIDTLSLLTSTTFAQNDFKQALSYGEQALELCQKNGIKSEQPVVLDALASVHRKLGNLQKALDYAHRSYELLEKIGDIGSQAQVLLQLSRIHHLQGDMDNSLNLGFQSLSLSQQIGYSFLSATLHRHLGQVYFDYNNNEQARHHWETALSISQALSHQQLITLIEQSLALIVSKP